jgi:hypothetical protein
LFLRQKKIASVGSPKKKYTLEFFFTSFFDGPVEDVISTCSLLLSFGEVTVLIFIYMNNINKKLKNRL